MKSRAVQIEPAPLARAQLRQQNRWVRAGLAVVLLLYGVMSCIGITWGLPSRDIDKFLFAEGEVWPGEKIYRLAQAGKKFSAERTKSTGADVDADPLDSNHESLSSPQRSPLKEEGDLARQEPRPPLLLTGTEEDVAKIYLRYRLYTYQPDEMITMMALAGMRPGELQFDPRLYQYGGLFLYPVGALIKLCGMLGLIDVRSDLVFYLDHPDEFGKFYAVARAYSAAWGMVGVLVVFALARRISTAIQTTGATVQESEVQKGTGSVAGLIAAFLFALMPVVVCMSHEGKPHLAGAVLMLMSVYLAMRAVSDNRLSNTDNRKFFWLMCVCCGAAVGMVLSSWPICVLIPLTAAIQYRRAKIEDRSSVSANYATLVGGLTAIGVYLASNPYVLINLFTNREVLRSNFGNSLAMYEVSRIGEGFLRVLQLTVEGATLAIVVFGMIGLVVGITLRPQSKALWLLLVPAALFFAQFVLIGAGKPPEYGRFGIFTNTVLAIGAAVLLSGRWLDRVWGLRALLPLLLLVWTGYFGLTYLHEFHKDALGQGTRLALAREIHDGQYGPKQQLEFALLAEPAPYSCPPLPFDSRRVWLLPDFSSTFPDLRKPILFIRPWDQSISWANKFLETTRWTGPSQ